MDLKRWFFEDQKIQIYRPRDCFSLIDIVSTSVGGFYMHPSNSVSLDNLKEVVYWHRPNAEAVKKFEAIAKASEDFMRVILENAPDCADRSVALRAAREARMWANAAVSLDPESVLPIDHERQS